MSSRQERDPIVIGHSPCSDGQMAMLAAWKVFGDRATYIGWNHGQTMPALREKTRVYFVDLCPSLDWLLANAHRHIEITILDHHVSAVRAMEAASEAHEIPSNVKIVLNTTKSGARLAWEYFHGTDDIPALVLDVEDRDLWTFNRETSRAAHAALMSFDFSFDTWNDFLTIPESYRRLIRDGEAIVRSDRQRVEELAAAAQTAIMYHEGYHVQFPAVNANVYFASELGNLLLSRYPEAPFTGVYRDNGNGTRSWSLRSEEGRMDVSLVAAMLGGGGHRNAAGCEERLPGARITFVGR